MPETLDTPALELIEIPGERDAYLPLLRLADDSESEIQRYYRQGDLYGLRALEADQPLGQVLVVATSEPATAAGWAASWSAKL